MQKKVRFINNYCLKTIEHNVLYEPNSAILSLTKLGRTIFFVHESAENVFLIIFEVTEWYKRTKLPALCLAFRKVLDCNR